MSRITFQTARHYMALSPVSPVKITVSPEHFKFLANNLKGTDYTMYPGFRGKTGMGEKLIREAEKTIVEREKLEKLEKQILEASLDYLTKVKELISDLGDQDSVFLPGDEFGIGIGLYHLVVTTEGKQNLELQISQLQEKLKDYP